MKNAQSKSSLRSAGIARVGPCAGAGGHHRAEGRVRSCRKSGWFCAWYRRLTRQSLHRERCCSRSSAHVGVEDSIEITGQFLNYFLAVHCDSLRRKYLFSFWRSFNRARNSRDFTAASEIPKIWEVSSVEIPSTSRSRKATRKIGSSSRDDGIENFVEFGLGKLLLRRRPPVLDFAENGILILLHRLIERHSGWGGACAASSGLR